MLRTIFKDNILPLLFFAILSVIGILKNNENKIYKEEVKEIESPNKNHKKSKTYKGIIGDMKTIITDTIEIKKYKYEFWCPLIEEEPRPKEIKY
jgi:hypothetical protein